MFKKNRTEKTMWGHLQYFEERNTLFQKLEDDKLDLYISAEVEKMIDYHKEYLLWEEQTKGMEFFAAYRHPSFPGHGVIIRNPSIPGYTIYNSETARFINIDINKEITNRFNQKKKELWPQ